MGTLGTLVERSRLEQEFFDLNDRFLQQRAIVETFGNRTREGPLFSRGRGWNEERPPRQ